MTPSIIAKTADKTEYFYSRDTNDVQIVTYHVLPGIDVSYISVNMEEFDFAQLVNKNCEKYVGIYYCKEGHIEQELNNEFFYMMPGDCTITARDKFIKKCKFPLSHYHGISIEIDIDALEEVYTSFLTFLGVAPFTVASSLCIDYSLTVLRSAEINSSFFEDLYKVEDKNRCDYIKVKLPELLYFIKQSALSPEGDKQRVAPRMQVDFVKDVVSYISNNINERITVKELTSQFGVSDTYLQSAFKKVYGMPVISFIRAQKMQSAAQILIHSTRSIDDIAKEFGYENDSKFSAAFKKIMGDTPGIYRKAHSNIKIM